MGRATAELFAKNGYNVVLAARNAEKLSEAKAQLSRHFAPGRSCLGISTDITKGDAVDALVARVTEQCESVDILINCAGTVLLSPTDDVWPLTFPQSKCVISHRCLSCTKAACGRQVLRSLAIHIHHSFL